LVDPGLRIRPQLTPTAPQRGGQAVPGGLLDQFLGVLAGHAGQQFGVAVHGVSPFPILFFW
jgi:hypothetical protein